MTSPFSGKRIVVGVTGSIAAFKVAGWVSTLAKEEALIDVVMTEAATRFVSPLTFSALSGRPVYTDMFRAEQEGNISHISLSRGADCILIAPATARTIARLAHGLADDLLSTTVLAARIPVIVCPAMNVQMYAHRATAANLETLGTYGYRVIEPDSGAMACGDKGSGRLPEWDRVCDYVLRDISGRDLAGQKVLVTAGPTREPYDPVRFISNPSSGKMGYALARTAFRRGAEVTLISGPTALAPPAGVHVIRVSTAQQMYEAVMAHYRDRTIIVKAAAVSDFRCAEQFPEKVKKEGAPLTMNLERTPDILWELGQVRDPDRQVLIGFAAESSAIEEEGRKKLERKRLDLIAVNDISGADAGFEVDDNRIILIDAERLVRLPHASKLESADSIWDHLVHKRMLKAAPAK